MTRNRDIDRVLEAWLVDGPSEMPDRLFEAVFDRVGRVPQRRLARLRLRFAEMSSTARFIAAGAAAILVIGIGLTAFGRGPDGHTGASPSPSASPSASAATLPIPGDIRHHYLGALRQQPVFPAGQDRSIIEFTEDTFAYDDSYFQSSASAGTEDTVQLVAENTFGGCVVGDVGLYGWALSPGGSKLTLTPQSDTCASRSAVLAGEWQRSDCPNADNLCLGDLEAGRYSSQFIDPFIPEGAPWKARFGALTYEVPAGWANTEDFPLDYRLERQTAPADTGIFLFGDVQVVDTDADSCGASPATNVGRAARAITDWLAAAPGVVASDPNPVTIGGLSGWQVDVTIDPSWTITCSETGSQPMRALFTDSKPGAGFQWGVQADDHLRLFILDLGDGRALLVDIQARTKADYDALVEEATTIVESFEFTR